jgi:hypothetical protein
MMAMAGRASADLVHEYVPPSTDPILVEWDVTMDCKNTDASVSLPECRAVAGFVETAFRFR